MSNTVKKDSNKIENNEERILQVSRKNNKFHYNIYN